MAIPLSCFLLCFYGLLSHLATAESVLSFWTVPDGDATDPQTFNNGVTLPIAWKGWNGDYISYFLGGTSIADLWITTFNYDQHPYNQFITGKWCTRPTPLRCLPSGCTVI
jgi:hypothetical protein